MTRASHRVAVPVAGGDLTVGVWDAEDPAAPTILAIHGVTSSHLAWEFLAESLPGVRIVAPDHSQFSVIRCASITMSGPLDCPRHQTSMRRSRPSPTSPR